MVIEKISKVIKDNSFVKGLIYRIVKLPVLKEGYNFIYFRAIKRKLENYKPKLIAVETLNICNLGCIMCPYYRMTRKKTLMSMPTYKKIIDDLARNGVQTILLNFYNEPFLDKHIFERIKYVKQKGLSIKFFSNGTVMSREKADKLLKCPPDEIMFSFDGFSKKTYENIRKGANFEKTLSNIKYLMEEKKRLGLTKPKIWMKLVLMKANEGELKSFKKFWDGKADNIEIGTVDNRSQDDLDIVSLKKLKPEKYPCPRAWSDMTVMSNGKVTFCCIDFDGKYVVGDMKKQSFNEVWNSEKYKSFRKLHLQGEGDKIPLCKNCSQLYRNSAFSWWSFK